MLLLLLLIVLSLLLLFVDEFVFVCEETDEDVKLDDSGTGCMVKLLNCGWACRFCGIGWV